MGHQHERYRLELNGYERDVLLRALHGLTTGAAPDAVVRTLHRRLLDCEPFDPRPKIDDSTLTSGPRTVVTREATAAESAGFDRLLAAGKPPARRHEVLDRASQLIGGDRADTYGDATDSHARIGALWGAILDTPVTATDVARCMIAMKISRLQHSPDHADSWVDIAGYAALGAEIAGARL